MYYILQQWAEDDAIESARRRKRTFCRSDLSPDLDDLMQELKENFSKIEFDMKHIKSIVRNKTKVFRKRMSQIQIKEEKEEYIIHSLRDCVHKPLAQHTCPTQLRR